ncbi:hypothetical protein G6F24_015659 [Rhizopus arrhizus]|nr:hypothetical protein G6F24_015659 [Rhizopus arrhizus]
MDLGLHLGAAAAEDDAQTRIVVLEEDGETIGLRVSAVEDVANLTDSQIEPPDTARICQISNDLFRGVARVSPICSSPCSPRCARWTSRCRVPPGPPVSPRRASRAGCRRSSVMACRSGSMSATTRRPRASWRAH